jgi:hypothetical protein
MRVQAQFHTTVAPQTPIWSIERIENPRLFIIYAASRAGMRQMGHGEYGLFHGTETSAIQSITQVGFSRSFAGVNGVAFGQGAYFASDANYSVPYCKGTSGTRYMFLARVILGKTTTGTRDTKRAPDGFDSTGNGDNIFVSYCDSNTYPAYVIRF